MHAPASPMMIEADSLRAVGCKIFRKAGCDEGEASLVANALVEANLAGHESHGVVRIAQYVGALMRGEVIANRHAELTHESAALALFDGGQGFGQVVGREAVLHGIAMAKRTGAAVVGLGRSGHLGRLSDFAGLACAEGQISLHFVNVPGGLRVSPYGGREPRFGTNPMAAGVPVPGAEPILLDFSTASVPVGKVQVAKNRGEQVAPGLLLDSQGKPTCDPSAVFQGGSILPIAEHRGSGLSLIIELLAGALTGGGTSGSQQPFLYNNMLSIFIDATNVRAGFADDARHFVDWVRAAAPIDPEQPVQLPGDRSRHTRARRGSGPLHIDATTWTQIADAARKLGLSEQEIAA